MGVKLKVIFCLFAVLSINFSYGQERFGGRPTFSDDFVDQDISFYGEPTDQFWRQFFDVYNYRGPLEQDPFYRPLSRPFRRPSHPNFDIQEQFSSQNYQEPSRPNFQDQFPRPTYDNRFSRPDYFGPQADSFRPIREESTTNDREDTYNRYDRNPVIYRTMRSGS